MAAHEGGQSSISAPPAPSWRVSTNSRYACAKAGLNVVTIGLAEASAPKVRVNAIRRAHSAPTRARVGPDDLDTSFGPLGRIGDTSEVAPLAVHLASAASSFTTGAIVHVDGGIAKV